MIKFQATNALIHYISPIQQVSDRFQKRDLILDESWDKDGNHYSSFVLIEFTGDKMAQLDSFYPGQRVNVEGILSGREYNNRIYNSVKGVSVTPYQQQAQYTPQPAPMPGGYTQQPYAQYSQQPNGYQTQAQAPQPQYRPAPAPMPQQYTAAPMPATSAPIPQPAAPMPTASAPMPQPQSGHSRGPGADKLPFAH